MQICLSLQGNSAVRRRNKPLVEVVVDECLLILCRHEQVEAECCDATDGGRCQEQGDMEPFDMALGQRQQIDEIYGVYSQIAEAVDTVGIGDVSYFVHKKYKVGIIEQCAHKEEYGQPAVGG